VLGGLSAHTAAAAAGATVYISPCSAGSDIQVHITGVIINLSAEKIVMVFLSNQSFLLGGLIMNYDIYSSLRCLLTVSFTKLLPCLGNTLGVKEHG